MSPPRGVAKETTGLLSHAKAQPSQSTYGTTLAALKAEPPPVKITRSKSTPNLAKTLPTRALHLDIRPFRHHHIPRLYQPYGVVPHVLDDSPDINRPDWREHQGINQKKAIASIVLFIGAIVLSQEGPDKLSKVFGWILAVLSAWGFCYCCNEGFCRNRSRNRQLRRDIDEHHVVVHVDAPPLQIQASDSANAAAIPPIASFAPKP